MLPVIKKNIYILCESYLHLLIAAAIAKINPANVIYFGRNDLLEKIPKIEQCFNKFLNLNINRPIKFFDLSDLEHDLNSLQLGKGSILVTFYDTHYIFEFIRHKYKLRWDQVAIMDDGSANYFNKVSMPSLSRRLPKYIFNKLTGRFDINLSRYQLGGNPKIDIFYTLSPKFLYIISDKNSKTIISIKDEMSQVLKDFKVKSDVNISQAQTLITLAPVYTYKRFDKKKLIKYISSILNYSNNLGKVLIKPHPKDFGSSIFKDIKLEFSDLDIIEDIPIELIFEELKSINWFGLPSSAMLIRYFIYPERKDIFYIIPDYSSKFNGLQLEAFERILGKKFKLINTE